VWEEVGEYVFNHRKEAVSEDRESPRYSDDYIVCSSTGVAINATLENGREIANIARLLGETTIPNQTTNFATEPEHVYFRNRFGVILYTTATGEMWKLARTDKPMKSDKMAA
jgi:hypothetical protein